MNFSIRPYLFDAINLIKSNFPLLLIPTVIVFVPYLSMTTSNNALTSALFIFSAFSLLVVYPLIYGKFVAIINDVTAVSWWQLFALHWWNYVIVKLVLHSPILLLKLLALVFELELDPLVGLISVVLGILSIYIVPMVFLTYQRLASISLGIKCLLGNFRFSLPLIILAVSPIVLELLPATTDSYSDFSAYYIFAALPWWLFMVLIDFTVFVAASLVLKDKLLKT
jgi:hypothetical protein